MSSCRRSRGALLVAALASAPAHLLAAPVTSQWFGGSGSWNVASNWTNSPAVSDYPNNGNSGDTWDALLFAGNASMSTDIALQNLIVNGGTVSGTGKITAAVDVNWTSGTINNSTGVELSAGGTITLGGTSGSRTLATTMTNFGTATWSGSGGVFGFGPFTNQSIFDITQDGLSGGAFGASFVNNGTLTKVSGSASRFGSTFSNTSLVVVNTGTRLDFNNAVAQRSTISNVSTLTGGTWNVSGEMHFNNTPDQTIAALGSGASVTLNTSSSLFPSVDSLASNAGTFAVTGGRSYTTAGAFSNTGTLSVGSSSTLTVTTSLAQLSGGTLSAGTYSIGGTLVLPASVTTNQANVTFSGSTSVCTAMNGMTSNSGTLVFSSRNFTAAGFSNSGTVTLLGSSAVTITGDGTQSGTFNIGGLSGGLTFDAGNQTFNTPTFGTGLTPLTIAGVTNITASSNWNAPFSTVWSGGSMGGAGSVEIPSGATLQINLSNSKTLSTTMDNGGHIIWSGSSGVGGAGTLNNPAGSLFEIQAATTQAFGISHFNNAGDVTKTIAGVSPSFFGGSMMFNNTGSVDVQAGQLNINGPITQISGSTLTAGTWKATGATLTLNGGSAVNTIGASATVVLSGSTSSVNAVNALANNQGSFTITNGKSFTTAGALANSGNITIGPSATLVAGGTIHDTGTLGFTGGQLNLVNKKMVSSEAIGAWNGSAYTGLSGAVQLGQIMTTSNFAGLTGVAIAPASETSYVGNLFGGVLVGSGDTLLMYTLAGDANLDAVVNADDYFQIDSNYNKPAASHTYSNGDFNYDGKINGDDYAKIDASFAGQSGFSPAVLPGAVTAVPEPASIVSALMLGVVVGGLRGRRVRHQ